MAAKTNHDDNLENAYAIGFYKTIARLYHTSNGFIRWSD